MEGREGGREKGREGGRKGGREGGRKGGEGGRVVIIETRMHVFTVSSLGR